MTDYPQTVLEFRDWFSTEQACRAYLVQLRWPTGVSCPACTSDRVWTMTPPFYRCRQCGYDFTATVGTLFADTNKPLRLWFEAIWYITNQKYGASALGVKRVLGLGSYRTAWNWLHKLRRAMVRPGRDRLAGVVEVDETFLGAPQPGKRGRGAGGLFRDPAVTFLGSLMIASLLATFSFFVTEPLLGMNFIPPYLYGLTMPPAFVLPGIFFLSRSNLASRAVRSAPALLAALVVLTALIIVRSASEQKSNRFFRNSAAALPAGLAALADHIKRTTSVNDVFLSTKELGFMLNGLTGRKLVTNRWLHQNDPYLNLPARYLAAAVILYGNDLSARLALLRQYSVNYLYWDFNWAATEYQVGQNGQAIKMNPLHPLDRPEARALLDRYGVKYAPATTWLDPAVNLPVYRQYQVLLVSRENYRRSDMPWEPALDPHLEEVWAHQENGRTIAALYRIR